VRQLGPHEAAANAESGEISLVAEPLGELERAAGDRSWIEVYDR
jgi:hypothetical protein